MKSWTKLGVPLAAIALLIAGSAAAYAAAGRGPAPSVEREQNVRDEAASLAICAADAPDCDDTIIGICLETADCGQEPGVCPPGTACIEPWLMDPPVCPDDVPIDVCFPDARPLMPYVCTASDGGVDEAFACKCFDAPPMPGSIPPDPGIEPPPGGVTIACPPFCAMADAPCDPCSPLALPPVTFDPTEPSSDPNVPVIHHIECVPPPCVPGPAIDCAPLPCDLPIPLPEPMASELYKRFPCVPPPCITPLAEPLAPELRGDFPCVLPPEDCITYPDGSGACSGSSGGLEPTIIEPAEAR